MTLARRNPIAIFVGVAVTVNIAISLLVRHFHSPLVTAGACADLLISIPAIYYFLLVRPGVQPLITLVPVLLSGLLRVTYIGPVCGLGKVAVGALCECGIAWFLIRRGRHSLLARVFMSEFEVFRYALASWGMKPDVSREERVFTIHQQSGAAALFGLLAAVSVLEAVVLHLVIHQWSPNLAWFLTAISIYGALAMIALARGFILLPIVVRGDSVLVRAGLLWSVEIARENIERITQSSEFVTDQRSPGFLSIRAMAEPNLIIDLHQSVNAEGLYGRRKSVKHIAIAADQPRELLEALQSPTAGYLD